MLVLTVMLHTAVALFLSDIHCPAVEDTNEALAYWSSEPRALADANSKSDGKPKLASVPNTDHVASTNAFADLFPV